MRCLSLVHYVLSTTDPSNSAVRLFLLDFSKAFDRIDHNILVDKLQKMNAPQTILNWIRSFLSDRRQRVKLTNCESDRQTLNGGVPQGSVLGPVLFLVMTNYLLTDWHNRWKHVNDCSFAESVTPMKGSKLQELVNVIYNWTESNNMKMNIGKCKEMIFDFARVKQGFLPTFYLYMLRVLKRSNADTSTLLTVYSTIIRPVLEYACEVWHCNITEYLSDDIEKIQKRALRIVLPTASYQEARQFTGIPLLKERRQTLCQRFFAKNAQGTKMGELLPPKLEHDYNKRSRSDCSNYKCKTDGFLKSFLPQMISLRNSTK